VVFSSHVVCSDEAVEIDCTRMLGGTLADIMCALKMTKDAMDRSVAKEKYLFFDFSGHGTQVVDEDGDEEDGFDEALCPSDFEVAGSLTDDVLCGWLESLPAHRLFAVCDCCHSGTCLDLGEFDGFFASGCRDDECAADARDGGGKTGGALTMMLLNALCGSDCSGEMLQQRIEASCASGQFLQRPVLQCTCSSVLHGWGAAKEAGSVAGGGSGLQRTGALRAVGGAQQPQGDATAATVGSLESEVGRLQASVDASGTSRVMFEERAVQAEASAAAASAALETEQQSRQAAEGELLRLREQLSRVEKKLAENEVALRGEDAGRDKDAKDAQAAGARCSELEQDIAAL
jgi:hypothetical protein